MASRGIEYDWNHTASLLAIIAEANRDPKKRSRPYRPEEFHPMTARRRRRRDMTAEEAESALRSFAGIPRPEPPDLWEQIKARVQSGPPGPGGK